MPDQHPTIERRADMVYVFLAVFALLTAIPHFVTAPSSWSERPLLHAARALGPFILHILQYPFLIPIYALLMGFNLHQIMNFLQEKMEEHLAGRHGEKAERPIDRKKPRRLRKKETRTKPHNRRDGLMPVKNRISGWEMLPSTWAFFAVIPAAKYGYGWIPLATWSIVQTAGLVLAREDRTLFRRTLELWILATFRTKDIRGDIHRLAPSPPSQETAPGDAATARYRVQANTPPEDTELAELAELIEFADHVADGQLEKKHAERLRPLPGQISPPEKIETP